jgi:hypothetical protein
MKVFLASSNELAHEREFLAGVVFRLGGLMHGMGTGLRVELVKWEYLDSSMGIEHKQDEYNRELSECDAAVVLFWRKFGEYTESEFLTALRGVREGGRPRRLTVLFKESGEEASPELAAYRASLPGEYGIEPKAFSGDGELRALFLETVFKGLADEAPLFRVPAGDTLKKYGLA